MKISYTASLQAPMLDVKQEQEAITRWQKSGNVDALEILIRSHARQVYAYALRLTQDPTKLEDLFAEGVIGLIRAANNFDLTREVRFSTYAHWWILNSVTRAVSQLKSIVDIPQQSRRTAPEPGFSELANFAAISLDTAAKDNAPAPFEQIQSPEPSPEERLIARSQNLWMRSQLQESVEELGDIERAIITSRGLTDAPASVDTLAKKLGLSTAQLRKLERRALSKLKFALMVKGVTKVG